MRLDEWRTVAIVASALAGLMALGLLILLGRERQRRLRARPVWARMLAEPRYFRDSIWRIFRARGYRVEWARVLRDPIDRQEHEVIFALRSRGELVLALCGRWVIPITSEVITRYQKALATTPASRGIILTTSHFTDAAREAARGLPIELHDAGELGAWIESIWG